MTNRQSLAQAISRYHTDYREEDIFRSRFLSLLDHPNCFQRTHLPGHITASAFIVDDVRQCVLLTHHAKLNRWLQPGGHADGDENVVRVAMREAQEETGIPKLLLLGHGIFDLDIHLIPEANTFPSHFHYDIRILMEAPRQAKLVVTHESHALAWVPFSELHLKTQNLSINRMAEKFLELF